MVMGSLQLRRAVGVAKKVKNVFWQRRDEVELE